LVRLSTEPPAHSIYWGSWIDGEVYGREGDAPWDSTTWSLFNANAEREPSLVHFGQPPPWSQAFKEMPLLLTAEGGAVPLMDMNTEGATLEGISQGKYDSNFKEWSSAVAKYGKPFFFRWDWEMNGQWFPWGKEAASRPDHFVKSWQRFHSIAEEAGATNITWVWCPNVLFEGSTSLASLYPGDAYVDWTCMDGYNRGTKLGTGSGDSWKSFSSVFKTTYTELLKLAPSKPIMVGETASTESGGSKATWIEDAFGTQLPSKFPNIKAVAWFNWNISDEKLGGDRWDWQIESSASAESAFANIITSPYYAANDFENLTPLKPIQPLP
jgi:Glycosyl hydrolase family 26